MGKWQGSFVEPAAIRAQKVVHKTLKQVGDMGKKATREGAETQTPDNEQVAKGNEPARRERDSGQREQACGQGSEHALRERVAAKGMAEASGNRTQAENGRGGLPLFIGHVAKFKG
jgi:hypothetical protein